MMMQLKSYELTPLNQRLIPAPLALAFGIATDDNFDSEKKDVKAQSGPYRQTVQHRKASPLRQRQQNAENAGGTQSAADGPLLPTAADLPSPEQPTASQPQMPVKRAAVQPRQLQPEPDIQAPAALESQAATAALPSNPSAAAAQAAASMQTNSSLSAGGYPHHHQHHAMHMGHAAHAAHVASANAAVMHASLRGFPASGYGFSPHTASLLPYMAPAPQVAVSNLTGSLGCPPLSVYSGPAEYGHMVRGQQQEEPQDDNQARALKRPRLVWTPQLHNLFEEAVQKLGLEKAVPKTIMQMMNVDGLTRENVASHLQKYRLSLKKTEPDDKSASAAAAADGADATSAEKAQQQDAAGASAAATGGAEGGTSSSAGNCGNGGSCSSSEPDGAGSSSSKGTRSDKAASDSAEPTLPAAAAAAQASVAGVAAEGAPADEPIPMQLEQQPVQQRQQQESPANVHQPDVMEA